MSKSKAKKTGLKKVSPKKELSEQVANQLRVSLDGLLKQVLGEKKFENRIKKAGKLLIDGVKLKATDKPKKLSGKKAAEKTKEVAETPAG